MGILSYEPICKGNGRDDVIDHDDSKREADGNISMIWERDAEGKPISAGRYGVMQALRHFCTPRNLEVMISNSQFLIQK